MGIYTVIIYFALYLSICINDFYENWSNNSFCVDGFL